MKGSKIDYFSRIRQKIVGTFFWIQFSSCSAGRSRKTSTIRWIESWIIYQICSVDSGWIWDFLVIQFQFCQSAAFFSFLKLNSPAYIRLTTEWVREDKWNNNYAIVAAWESVLCMWFVDPQSLWLISPSTSSSARWITVWSETTGKVKLCDLDFI